MWRPLWLRGLLCRWPSITEWEMYITAQGPRLRNDLYCVEWDVKLYYTIILLVMCIRACGIVAKQRKEWRGRNEIQQKWFGSYMSFVKIYLPWIIHDAAASKHILFGKITLLSC